jgi:hypothetical protein
MISQTGEDLMTFVFTFSGFRAPKHLYQSIKFCRLANPNSFIFLIGNTELRVSKKIKSICKVHRINEKLFLEYQNVLRNSYPDQNFAQNGFWFKSIERFLMIDEWIRNTEQKLTDFIHLEADCISFVDKEVYMHLRQKYTKLSVPVDLDGNCIPSIIYYPDTQQAIEFSKYVKSRITGKVRLPDFYCNDITMLNEFKSLDKISHLPSIPSDNSVNSPGIIFDPAYLGEYIFGKDIRHNNFIQKSGYIPNSKYKLILKESIFLTKSKPKNTLNIMVIRNGKEIQIANLHNYSKRYDLFNKSNSFKNLKEALSIDEKTIPVKRFKFLVFCYFVFDKIEYNIRVKWRRSSQNLKSMLI